MSDPAIAQWARDVADILNAVIPHAFSVRTTSSSLSMTPHDYLVRVDASGGTVDISLPSSRSAIGREYHVKKVDTGSYPVRIFPLSGDTVDSNRTLSVTTVHECYTLMGSAGVWDIV